jgi:hypothetical protein
VILTALSVPIILSTGSATFGVASAVATAALIVWVSCATAESWMSAYRAG